MSIIPSSFVNSPLLIVVICGFVCNIRYVASFDKLDGTYLLLQKLNRTIF